ncbi:MAG TPA: hypothetical protein VFV67_32935 [Actinophytocola sp.]|uniref:hypothetical protein n=1 Tax=Actinophytocola sp. TaxID=1872138 RepID=UPI002DBD1E96|nr:hypothetical protein [Actinophytocola sp.]HEU5475475.1 hypothetical protein [Actinophytocola sp.]
MRMSVVTAVGESVRACDAVAAAWSESPWNHARLKETEMLVLIIVLLAAWLIVAVIGFALNGLLWLGIVGIVLFVATAVIGAVRRKALRRTTTG